MLMICAFCLGISGVTAFAENEAPTSGTCGENVTWELDEDGTLTISGNGAMKDFEHVHDEAPWGNSCLRVNKIVINNGGPILEMMHFTGAVN